MNMNLDQHIGGFRNQPIPSCPDNLEANVLRKIRLAEANAKQQDVVGWLNGLIPQTGFALPTIILVIAVSATVTVASTMALTSNRKTELNRALGFDTITATQVVNLDRF